MCGAFRHFFLSWGILAVSAHALFLWSRCLLSDEVTFTPFAGAFLSQLLSHLESKDLYTCVAFFVHFKILGSLLAVPGHFYFGPFGISRMDDFGQCHSPVIFRSISEVAPPIFLFPSIPI